MAAGLPSPITAGADGNVRAHRVRWSLWSLLLEEVGEGGRKVKGASALIDV